VGPPILPFGKAGASSSASIVPERSGALYDIVWYSILTYIGSLDAFKPGDVRAVGMKEPFRQQPLLAPT
jgi:hypothetical protein